MPKYRLLTNEELIEMKKDFVNYLVVNGITADDWKNLLETNKEKAQTIIDLFSDVVFEKILRGVNFVLRTSKKEIIAFHCIEETIEMCGLVAGEGLDVDFTNHEVIAALIANPVKGLETIHAEKPYSKTREMEIFELTENGGLISDGNVYNALKSIT